MTTTAAVYTLTVKVRRGGGSGRFGDPSAYTYHDIEGCVKWPRTSSESADYAQTTLTGYMLSLPAGSDVTSSDEILLPGEPEAGPWWAIDGEPLPWGPSPFTGETPGIVAALTRSAG